MSRKRGVSSRTVCALSRGINGSSRRKASLSGTPSTASIVAPIRPSYAGSASTMTTSSTPSLFRNSQSRSGRLSTGYVPVPHTKAPVCASQPWLLTIATTCSTPVMSSSSDEVEMPATRSATAVSSAARDTPWVRSGWIRAIDGTSMSRSDRQPARRSGLGEGASVPAAVVVAGGSVAPAVGSCVGAVGVHATRASATRTPAVPSRAIAEILRRRSIVRNPRPI